MAENDKKDANSDVTIESQPETAAKAKTGFVHTTAFKCVIVLLIIVVVCAVFLTIFNALFEVTDQERTDRAAKKIYGEKVTTQQEVVDTSVNVGNASVNLVYTIKEYPNDYLINVTGKGGYSGGTVTCYVVVTVTNGEISIGNISISENDGQSFISNIKDSYLEEFAELYGTETTSTDEYHVLYTSEDGFYINMNGSTQIATGASYSWTAICNAVNGAVSYVEQVYLGMEGAKTGYSDAYVYTDYIDLTKTSHTVSGSNVTYTIITKDCNPADPFTIEITVGEGGVINSYSVVVNGSTAEYGSNMVEDPAQILVGLDMDGVLALIDPDASSIQGKLRNDGELTTGASWSNYACIYAALFATANYDQAISDGTILPGGAEEEEIEYTDKDYTGYEFIEYIDSDRTDYSVMGDGTIVFNIVTATYEHANPFSVDITVGLNDDNVPVILDYVIVVDGSNTAWSDGEIKAVQGTFKGRTLKDIEDAMLWTDDCEYIISKEITGSFLYNGSSESNTLCARAALFALANYWRALPTEYDGFKNIEYINLSKTSYYVVGDQVTFTVVTGGFISANPFTVEVTVASNDGTPYIVSLSIIVDGSNTKWSDETKALLEENYKDKTIDYITGCLYTKENGSKMQYGDANSNGEGWMDIWNEKLVGEEATSIYNGSSESCFLVAQAAMFALENYGTIANDYAERFGGYENTEYINLTDTTYYVVGDQVTFTVVTGGYVSANPFTVEVTVGRRKNESTGECEAYIVSLSIIVDGSNTKWDSDKISTLEKNYEGLTFSDIYGCFDTENQNTKEVGTANTNGEGWMGIWKDTLIGFEDRSIYNGSSESCFLVAQAAMFALANYGIIACEYAELYAGYENIDYINLTETTFSVVGDTVIFTVVTGDYVSANPFTVEITVAANEDGDPYIVSLSIIVDGSNTKWSDETKALLEENYKDKTIDYITGCLYTEENGTKMQYGDANSNGEGWMDIWNEELVGKEATSIYNGSSESCFLVAQAAMFALSNYNLAMETVSDRYKDFECTDYINLTETTYTINEDGTVTYTVVTGSAYHAHPFTVEITVGCDEERESAKILSLSVIVDGSNEKWSYGQKYILGQSYVGMTYDDIEGCFRSAGDNDRNTSSGEGSLGIWKGSLEDNDTSIYNGSSESCFLVAQAALFALANFATIINSINGGSSPE